LLSNRELPVTENVIKAAIDNLNVGTDDIRVSLRTLSELYFSSNTELPLTEDIVIAALESEDTRLLESFPELPKLLVTEKTALSVASRKD